ncbi:hypothetical protein [Skermanella stibiiresistens]|uniref:hypothetical protein n=1 Tax=Skermanella stibiiresistens TaxID=913326 RepID=UPI0012F93B98|nr:hypothetical protein [Skermanella stibiiresistens]
MKRKSNLPSAEIQSLLDAESDSDYIMPIEEFMDRNFGPGTWRRDVYARQYIACRGRTASGRGYIIVNDDSTSYPLEISTLQLN